MATVGVELLHATSSFMTPSAVNSIRDAVARFCTSKLNLFRGCHVALAVLWPSDPPNYDPYWCITHHHHRHPTLSPVTILTPFRGRHVADMNDHRSRGDSILLSPRSLLCPWLRPLSPGNFPHSAVHDRF